MGDDYTLTEDELLYENFKNGNEEAFENIIELHKRSLVLFIYEIVKDMDLAEELMIDTFAQLIVSKAKWKKKSSFKTWLFAIGQNIALKEVKRRKKQAIQINEINYDGLNCNIYKQFVENEEKVQLYDSMQKIKQEYRQVLYLIYFEEMSYEEISRVMKKSKKRVDNLAYRGKLSLKNVLEKDGFKYEK